MFTAAALLLAGCAESGEPGAQSAATTASALASATTLQPSAGFAAALAEFQSTVTKGNYPTSGESSAKLVGDVTPITPDPAVSLPVSLNDADGYEVTVTDISRILPLDLYGTTSRTLAGLGLGEHIIGRSVSSTEPLLQDVPVVTQAGHNINVEAVLNLHPTLVIVDHSIGPAEAIDQIRAAGVTVVVIQPSRTIDSIGDDIRTIAGITGVNEAGEQLARRAEAERDEAIAAISAVSPATPLDLAFIYARGTGGVFFILGPEAGTTDLFSAVGAHDTAADAGLNDTTPANAEALVKLNPEVIVMMSAGLESTGGVPGLLARPGIAQTTAGQQQRIVAIPDSQALSFGPQTGEMLLAFAQALYGPLTDS
ncbi:hemin ABC transporter substrate-binding protein [Corynebacterium choanae]|nr:ABC transporter substrate-binding protein [Corynebacterium choanae]